MVGIPGLYFVIAGDDHARFVRPDADNALHTIAVIDLASLPASGGKGPGTGRADAPHMRFARLLAKRIDEDFAVDLFTDLVLVAPPHLLRELTARLDLPTRASLLGSLAKDLMAVPDLELWPYLLSWNDPVLGTGVPAVPTHGW